MKVYQFYDMMPSEADAQTADISTVQLMRAGTFKYYDASELDITPDILRRLKASFDNNVRKCDLAIDYYHNDMGDAAGWIKSVELRNSDTEMWIAVDWTPAAEQKIRNRELRYLSADFNRKWEDNETGVTYEWVLNGGGLTNRPFIKGMSAILSEVDLSEEKRQAIKRILSDEVKTMDFADLKKEIFALSDEQKKELVKLCGGEAQAIQLSEANKERDALKSEVVKLTAKLAAAEKESQFAVLLSEGKAVEAQKDAFMKGDMAEFVKLSQPVNLSEKGHGKGPTSDGDAPKTAAEAEDKVLQLAEAKRKEDSSLQLSDAISQVLRENADLAKMYN